MLTPIRTSRLPMPGSWEGARSLRVGSCGSASAPVGRRRGALVRPSKVPDLPVKSPENLWHHPPSKEHTLFSIMINSRQFIQIRSYWRSRCRAWAKQASRWTRVESTARYNTPTYPWPRCRSRHPPLPDFKPSSGRRSGPQFPISPRAIIFIDYSQRSVERRSQRISARIAPPLQRRIHRLP